MSQEKKLSLFVGTDDKVDTVAFTTHLSGKSCNI